MCVFVLHYNINYILVCVYILIEETKMKELRIQAIKRAITYEERAYVSKKRIVKECIKDVERERPKMEEGGWERRRREELEKDERIQVQ